MSHTPGPWEIETSSQGLIVIGSNEQPVVLIPFFLEGEWEKDEWKKLDLSKRNVELVANARLIAAAPELYEELHEMLYYARCVYEQHGGDDEQRGLAPKIKKDIDRVEALLRRVDPEEDEHHDQP